MILDCNSSELNIEVCLLNGQTFRFAKVETDEENPVIRGVAMDRVWQFQRINDEQIEYQVLARFDEAVESEDGDILRQYFQLDVNLLDLYNEWSEKDTYFETQLKANFKHLTGVRVLQQDCLETFFAFICSSNNNVDRIKSMVNGLAELYGDELDVELDGEMQTFYNFPTIDQLYENRKGMEDELKKQKFGYRAGWIVKAVEKLHGLGGRDYLEDLKTQSYDEASKELMTFTGIGKKVSDCILLMALDHQNVVPIDTHVFRISQNYLPKLPKEYGKM
ncbi:DNA-(apurinic or apyrimidinic site) lyase [Aphelenchoides bicaudatus]|nr:DNA-(apurinic or apyrimidinic site) lyase [Aphelenchoides bicaudatus]